KPRNNNHVKLPRSGVFHEPIKCRSGILTAADSFVSIFFDDLETTIRGIVTERDGLCLCRLSVALRAYSHIEGRPFHDSALPQFGTVQGNARASTVFPRRRRCQNAKTCSA